MNSNHTSPNTTILANLSHHFYNTFESLLLDRQEHFYNPTMFVSNVFLNPVKCHLMAGFQCFEMLVGNGVFVDTCLVTEGPVWERFSQELRQLCMTYMVTRQHCINTLQTMTSSFPLPCKAMICHAHNRWLTELTEQHLLERELIHQVIMLAIQDHPDVICVHYRQPFNCGVPCLIDD